MRSPALAWMACFISSASSRRLGEKISLMDLVATASRTPFLIEFMTMRFLI